MNYVSRGYNPYTPVEALKMCGIERKAVAVSKKPQRPTAEQIELAESQIVEQSKRIDFYITEYSVEILAQKVHDGEYVVPSYQREFVWDDRRKSRFIESLIMGLPIPFVFFWMMPDGRLEIVDGSQRLRTISDFIYGDFSLGDLDPLTRLSGFRFADLPESRQRKIKNRSIRGIVLNEHADEAARLDMFERINTGSKNANPAEIRRGALAGPFMDLVMELAGLSKFANLAPISAKLKREREYEELITRFFAYGDGLEDYKDRPSEFIFSYVKQKNEDFIEDPDAVGKYRQRFIEMLDFVDRHFPYGFKKSATGRATPRSRFESISIGVAAAILESPDMLSVKSGELAVGSWVDSLEFQKITSADGANAKARLRGRIDFVKTKLLEQMDD